MHIYVHIGTYYFWRFQNIQLNIKLSGLEHQIEVSNRNFDCFILRSYKFVLL